MKKAAGYISMIVFAGLAILLFGSYSKWFSPEALPSNATKKEETDIDQVMTDHTEINLQEDLVASISGTNQLMEVPKPPPSNTMQVIVVPYFGPDNPDWQLLYSEADKNPGIIKYVIINPCSGPCGESLSADWQEVISELKKRDIKTLGYVFDIEQSIEYIDHYMKAPIPTDGIFFDNEGARYNNFERFKPYAEYVQNLGGIVYINPGFNYPYIIDYLKSGIVDVANVYEFDASSSHYIEVDRSIDQRQLSVILGNVFTTSEMIQMVHQASEEGIGIIYVYSDTYFGLPPYFSELVREAARIKVQPVTIHVRTLGLDGSPITGLWTEIFSGTSLVKTGYTTLSHTGNWGTQYQVCMSDYQNYVFAHWHDGSTNNCKTIAPTQNVTLTSYYKTPGLPMP